MKKGEGRIRRGNKEERRRECKRRWREAVDIMEEEDVMETSIMHLCIPDYRLKPSLGMDVRSRLFRHHVDSGLIVPSICSRNALSIVFPGMSDTWQYIYHFPAFDINEEPSNVVVIRNLPTHFPLNYSDTGRALQSLIDSITPSVSIEPGYIKYGVVRVKLQNTGDARRLVEGIAGSEFDGKTLTASEGRVRV